MSVISWGKCTISYISSVNGAPSVGAWTTIDTPKEDTTKITTSAGTEKTATEEGGALVDYLAGKATFQLEFDLFSKKSVNRPFVDSDGIIAGEYAIRIVPEDENCKGIQIDRCILRLEENYSSADGILLHYVAKCLKPASGNTLKEYVQGEKLVVTPSILYFSNAADTTGKTFTATATGNVSATSTASWCTVECAGQVVTVKVSANATSNARSVIIPITADNKTAQVEVLQIP